MSDQEREAMRAACHKLAERYADLAWERGDKFSTSTRDEDEQARKAVKLAGVELHKAIDSLAALAAQPVAGAVPDAAALLEAAGHVDSRKVKQARAIAAQCAPAPAADGLPELPEPHPIKFAPAYRDFWTAEQMRAYARQAFELGRQQAVPEGWLVKRDPDGWVYFRRPDALCQAITPTEPLGSHSETLFMLLSALAAAPQAPAPSAVGQWQPISTAPKDGTNVLLFNNAGHVAAGLWLDTARVSGWYLRGGNEPDFFFNDWRVTHWMPLPAPPASHGITEGGEG